MLISQTADVVINSSNMQYYKNLGYDVTHNKEIISVKVEHLQDYCKSMITVYCDYCGKVYDMDYTHYYKRVLCHEFVKKCACKKCYTYKVKEGNLSKYGVESLMQLEEVKEQFKKTCIEKYGVDNPSKCEEVKLKKEITTLANYGVDNPYKSDIVIKDIQQKRVKTMYENGTQTSSRSQCYICDELNGKLNYPIDTQCLDIAFPSEKLYIEYDGSGHDLCTKLSNITEEEFEEKELKRYYYLKNRGWKMIRIISTKDCVPEKSILDKMLIISREHFNKNHTWIKFDIDNNKVITSAKEEDFDYGRLFYFRYRDGEVKRFNKKEVK